MIFNNVLSEKGGKRSGKWNTTEELVQMCVEGLQPPGIWCQQVVSYVQLG